MSGEPRSGRRKMPLLLRLAITLLIAGALTYIVYSSFHVARVHVEVCVTYHNQSACREAAGRNRDEALRAAHDNACAQIASGVTATIGCQDTPATRVRWLPR